MTVEFETEIKNGSIEIPEKFRQQVKDRLKVVVSIKEAEGREELYDRHQDRARNFIKWLIKNPLKVDSSVPFLTREELYDRKL